jgi:hypothetical protein
MHSSTLPAYAILQKIRYTFSIKKLMFYGNIIKNMTLNDYCKLNNKEHLLQEWNNLQNGNVTPNDISWGSNKKFLHLFLHLFRPCGFF